MILLNNVQLCDPTIQVTSPAMQDVMKLAQCPTIMERRMYLKMTAFR